MSELFKKLKPYLDLTYLWEFPNKLIIPSHPNFTVIYTEELFLLEKISKDDILKITKIKHFDNKEVKYAQNAYLDSFKKARKIHNIMMYNNEKLIGSGPINSSIAHSRFIEISHANHRIMNILKCDCMIKMAS
jgi:hypothetical protein